MQDYFFRSGPAGVPLSRWTRVYQDVRLPRAQKAQVTSRQAGDVYEMEGEEFEGRSFEQCLPIVRQKLEGRMKWVWGADIDQLYDEVAAGVRAAGAGGSGGQLVNGEGEGKRRVDERHVSQIEVQS